MKNKLVDVVHDIAKDLYGAGVIDATTMREYDALCLPELKTFSATQIKKLRLGKKISQAVFAKLLNTTLSTVRQWEQGVKRPGGMALKLLNLVADKGIEVLY